MATLLEISTLAQDGEFQQRVRAAMVNSALSISGEPIGAMTEAQTGKRQAMATQVINGNMNLTAWSLAVANNPTVADAGLSATDNDILFTVNSVWDDMSGVTTADLTP